MQHVENANIVLMHSYLSDAPEQQRNVNIEVETWQNENYIYEKSPTHAQLACKSMHEMSVREKKNNLKLESILERNCMRLMHD